MYPEISISGKRYVIFKGNPGSFTPTSGQNGRYLVDCLFRFIFRIKEFCITIKTALKFGPNGSVDITLVLVQAVT